MTKRETISINNEDILIIKIILCLVCNEMNIKKQVKEYLTDKALHLWPNIEWDKEEVGNSVIGFFDLDPGVRAKSIARWINKKAEEIIK